MPDIPFMGLPASAQGSPSSVMVGQGATGLHSDAERCPWAREGLLDNPIFRVLIVGLTTRHSDQAIEGKTSSDHVLGFQ